MGRPPKPVDETTYAGRFAARLRTLREKAGMTGEEMANAITKAGFACPERTYYRWESGRHAPPLNAMPSIAAAMAVSVRTLFPNS